MNKCHFMGNLTRDPELKPVGTKGTNVANFGVAVSRKYKKADGEQVKEVVFIECEAWDTGAQTIARHFKKGDPIIVHCSAKTESWEDKATGTQRSRLKFRVNEFEFPMGRRREESGETDDTPSPAPAVVKEDENDIPF